jgi:hypothetical protein
MPPRKPPLTIVGPGTTLPPPPRTLGAPGLALWNRVQSEYGIIDCGGVEILCIACEATDRIQTLAEAIAEDGPVVRTRAGVRSHPALRDELQNRALVARLLSKLGINTEPIKTPGRPSSGIGWIPPERT